MSLLTEFLDDEIALRGGRWRRVHGVMRWSPDPTPSEVADLHARMKPARRTNLNVSDLIACPTCGAHANERCRSASGNPRENHAARLISVRCPCGEPVAPRKQYCEPCRERARKQTYRLREIRRPTVERRAS